MVELHDPGEGQVGQFKTKRLCQGRKFLKFLHSCFGGMGTEEQFFDNFKRECRFGVIHSGNLIFGDAVQVLSCQKSSSQRAPGNQPKVVFGRQRLIIDFLEFPHKHVVLILSSDGFMEVKLLTEGECLQYDFRFPVAGSPVEGLALLDDLMEAPADLLQRCFKIMNVSIEDVNIVHLQPIKRFLDAFPDVFPVGAGT